MLTAPLKQNVVNGYYKTIVKSFSDHILDPVAEGATEYSACHWLPQTTMHTASESNFIDF